MDPLNLLWFYFVLASLQPVIQRQLLFVRRRAALSSTATPPRRSSRWPRCPATMTIRR
jgi:hypothetical protein